MLTHGSLFSGIGGFDLGFIWANIRTIWQVEIDGYCRQVLARHFPEAERFSDIRDCGAHNLKPVDIISGGFPCVDISVAGKQAGIYAPRSGLWSEMHRIISELRPRFAVIENVANLVTQHDGRSFTRILNDLASIGYDAEWQCISANDVGAPHLRKRIWIVAYPSGRSGDSGGKRIRRETGSNIGRRCEGSEVAYPSIENDRGGDTGTAGRQESEPGESGGRDNIPNPSSPGLPQPQQETLQREGRGQEGGATAECGESLPDSNELNGNNGRPGASEVSREQGQQPTELSGSERPTSGWWTVEPNVGGMVDGLHSWMDEPDIPRVAKGVKNRMDRLKGLGNSIVPQIAEIIGRLL